MAISNFIPTVWSENLYSQLDKQYIAAKNCNREFEGDITEQGAVVNIIGVGEINVFNYTKDTNMSEPQVLSDTLRSLTIDQAKAFNFQIDDIDRAQCTPKLMDEAMKVAASALANEADKYIYSLYIHAEDIVPNTNATEDTIIDNIIEARTKLFKHNVTNASDIIVEVSPAVAELILKAKIDLATDNVDALENGCIGSVAGCKIFVSNNIAKETNGDTTYHKCLVRTKRSIAFAEQLSEIVAYRPEKRFADAVKGLHLYGAKVVYPEEMVRLDLGLPAEDEEE